ncbi:transglutaminase-like cysteine peptidase [Marinobacter sp. F3R08]|uniref:transglutaminase-like cysteine peptidase n=1 Tax=Marinobacter sp. F3R08 TaxID=2841559 RepID=UPI001C092287|nr:transglutaminase-like cysteine peptidase [Marinobacter sp. F3R08]MBU2953328.1 transglutaminase-like cysteine peptidase [Marinobacter sp. F3R08]
MLCLALLPHLPQASQRPVFAAIDFTKAQSQWRKSGLQGRQEVLEQWQSMLQRVSTLDTAEKLKQVNAFVHDTLAYQQDLSLWGREDYWATPLETLAKGRGDCEDFVIIQYVSLLHAGISDDKLRLIYVRARIGGPASPVTQPHMVLGYYPEPGAEPILLDSLIEDILPASERTDLTPVFSFNSSELWAGGVGASAGSSTARLSPWRNVLNRMKREGVSLNVSR